MAPVVPSPKRRASQEADLLGHTIEGKYQLSSVLGRGGMGTVYEATHRLTNRRVAVKVLLPEQADRPDAIARFHHEARVVSSIGHSNICEVIDFGRLADGRPFLVMERLEGETLGQLLDRKLRLELGEAVLIVRQSLQALEAAHAHGVIHRDMKPDNVFLIKHPGAPLVAKVLDFGVSKAMGDDRDVELTRTGMVMGTPYYMAPEQARGDRNLDGRVDVWAVGVLLYEALTGTRPFVAKNYNALLVQILTARQRPLLEMNPRIPRALEAVIDQALAKKREDRFPTVAAFAEALAPFAHHEAPRAVVRPRLDRFVEVGGVNIPVTWEDTGGETPASAGARVIEAKSLGTIPGVARSEAAHGAQAPAPDRPGPAGTAAKAAGHAGLRSDSPGRLATGQPPEKPSVGRGPSGADPGLFRPAQPPRPEVRGGAPRPEPALAADRPAVSPGSTLAESVGLADRSQARPPRAEVGARRSRSAVLNEGTSDHRRPAPTRPPVVEDEDTTKVLAGAESSSEAATPPVRRAGTSRPPVPPAPPPPPPEDVETTVVDLDPPTFSTDSYRAAKDRRET